MTTPRVAVVTPYHREPLAMLERCHASVCAQGVDADHLMIADGYPRDPIDRWDALHLKLPRAHDDNGNTPRGLGSLLASRGDYEFIAYLDADNWYRDDHLRSLLALWESGRGPVCASLRSFHGEDGTDLGITEEDEDALRHVDTSCLLIHRSGFECLPVWLQMPRPLSPICDRVFFAALLHRRLAVASTRARTVAFRSRYRVHYEAAGAPVPPDAKDAGAVRPAYDYLASGSGVTECVHRLGFWPLSYLAAG